MQTIFPQYVVDLKQYYPGVIIEKLESFPPDYISGYTGPAFFQFGNDPESEDLFAAVVLDASAQPPSQLLMVASEFEKNNISTPAEAAYPVLVDDSLSFYLPLTKYKPQDFDSFNFIFAFNDGLSHPFIHPSIKAKMKLKESKS